MMIKYIYSKIKLINSSINIVRNIIFKYLDREPEKPSLFKDTIKNFQ